MTAKVRHIHSNDPRELEASDPDAAIQSYLELIKGDHLNTDAYNRLMILYRKKKEYNKEVKLIQDAIKAYKEYFEKHRPAFTGKAATISRKLALAVGTLTKKGKDLFEPEPIAGWRKRLETAKKKVK